MNKRELKLYCFSPPVMLATFVIEIVLAGWTLWRYKLNEVAKLAVALLVFLAIFQLAEYNVCETGWVDSVTASRIGYVAITMLPPLGIHLAYAIAKAKKRPLMWPAYITGAAFIAFFVFIGPALSGHTCFGNYVIFQMYPEASLLYALYYYGWMLAGTWLAWRLATAKTKLPLYGLAVGYMAFILPTTTVNLIDPETIKGIPSIMCGFAVIFALTLAFWIMPKAGTKK
jgi:hypothetical protein